MKPSPQSSSQRIATLIEILPWCVSGVFLGLAIVSLSGPSADAQEEATTATAEALAEQKAGLQLAISKAELRIEGLQNHWDADQFDRAWRQWRKDHGLSWLAEFENGAAAAPPQEANLSAEERERRDIARQLGGVRAAAADAAESFIEEDELVNAWHRENPSVGARLRELQEMAQEQALAEALERAEAVASQPPPSLEIPAGFEALSEVQQVTVLGAILSESQRHVERQGDRRIVLS